MSELRQRDPRQEDAKHLAFVRTQPCCLPFCKRPAEAAHLRMGNDALGKEPSGMQEKPHDKYTVPLCPYHHRTGIDCQHNSNEREWWAMRGINPWPIAASLWIASGGAKRELQPKPTNKLRPVKARKPRERRAKIQGSKRTIPGRRFDGPKIQRVSKPTGHSTAALDECSSISRDGPSSIAGGPPYAESDFPRASLGTKARSLESFPTRLQQHQAQQSQYSTYSSSLPRSNDALTILTSDCEKRLPKRYSVKALRLAGAQHRASGKVDKWRGYAP